MKSATSHLEDYRESSKDFNKNFNTGLGNSYDYNSHMLLMSCVCVCSVMDEEHFQ